ncbi:helix-turn-helix domain-containing protein [Halosimplex sp. TS25]|uniref:helix-turn-helix transcriptional regulator n=1 Tax=Halosimplex rarum TaxID=3396619 RepID=UPI0039E9E580
MVRRHVIAVLLCLLFVGSAVTPLVGGTAVGGTGAVKGDSNRGHTAVASAGNPAATETDSGTASVNLTIRDGAVRQPYDNSTYVWQQSAVTLVAETNARNHRSFSVCLTVAGENVTDGCRSHSLITDDYTVTDEYAFDHWPTNRTGEQTVTVTVENETGGAVISSVNRTVVVIRPEGDFDSDRLTNEEEVKHGTGLNRTDTDKDGLEDGSEVMEYGTDPLDNDTDDDGLTDATEVNGKTNATDPDTDGDGLEDGAEIDEYDTDPLDNDTDDDGLSDAVEVDGPTDPTLADSDDDGLSDEREVDGPTNATVPDTDDDGLSDGAEVHTYGTDPTEADTDGDGLSDATEVSIGTNPTSPLTTVFIVIGVIAVLAVLRLIQRKMLPDVSSIGREPDPPANDAADGGETLDAPPDPVPPRILSDEDRVLQLLREADGRLPQNEITEKTDWSKSKVSRLLSKMEDSGEIEKINVGRQNIIALETAVPDSARSPFENAAPGDDT